MSTPDQHMYDNPLRQERVTTSTIILDQVHDYSALERRYHLIRYVLPDELRFQAKGDKTYFGRLYNTIKNQLDYPYRVYTHARIGASSRWALYVLYPPDAPLQELTLPKARNPLLRPERIAFDSIPLHLLIKLLQMAYFHGDISTRFVGQSACYVYGYRAPKNHYCVEIEIRGDLSNDDTKSVPTQAFHVIPHARRFGPISKTDLTEGLLRSGQALFGMRQVGSRFGFLQLKEAEVDRTIANGEAIYARVVYPGRKAALTYHNPQRIESSGGKIVHDFIYQFLDFLSPLGLIGRPRQRTFTQLPPPSDIELPLARLGVIGVYDNRLERTHPPADYIKLFAEKYPYLEFVALNAVDDAPAGGVLALLDADKQDFGEEAPLSDYQDPYPALYESYPHIPKQSINVNTNEVENLDGRSYLDYALIDMQEDTEFARKLEVALNELYLKCALLDHTERFPLPLVTPDRAFISKGTYRGASYTTALWFDGSRLRLANYGNPEEKNRFHDLLDQWGVEWDEQYDALLEAHKRIKDDGEKDDLTHFDLVLGPNLFVSIEELNERVLYDYEEIIRRQEVIERPYPPAYFRLSHRYDEVKADNELPLAILQQRGLIEKAAGTLAKTKQEHISVKHYRQLQAFDALLDEIEPQHPTITYRELTRGEWLERIGSIFGWKRDKDTQRYHSTLLTRKYLKLGVFQSDRGDLVRISQGLWRDDTQAYTVGSIQPMSLSGQPRAQLIRRFQALQGADHFTPEQLVQSMGVTFVRFHQFTVLPYYFHLLDLYVENVLRYQSMGDSESGT